MKSEDKIYKYLSKNFFEQESNLMESI